MIKVTLIGDSIRMMGYGKLVPSLLGEEFEVFQPNENCRFSKYTLRGMYDWKNDMEGSRIVHWNNGLWDICDLFGDGAFTSMEEYAQNMLRIADILLKRYDKVIFATTTPVALEQVSTNESIMKYNAMITELLEKKGIIINDLHKTVYADVDKYIRKDDKIHLTDEGAAVCAEQVTEIIRKTATLL